eukprot:3889490-Lingulodinium_polyedra.AAC.1
MGGSRPAARGRPPCGSSRQPGPRPSGAPWPDAARTWLTSPTAWTGTFARGCSARACCSLTRPALYAPS